MHFFLILLSSSFIEFLCCMFDFLRKKIKFFIFHNILTSVCMGTLYYKLNKIAYTLCLFTNLHQQKKKRTFLCNDRNLSGKNF